MKTLKPDLSPLTGDGEMSELIRVKSKIEASEQRFQAAMAAVEGVLWTNNAIGEMEGEQLGWAALTGQSYEEYQGYGWAKAVHPDDSQATIDAWNEAVRESKTFNFEHRVKTKTGEWREFSIKAIPLLNDDGSLREWVGIHTDITERKIAEAKIRESTQKLNIVIDASELGTWELNIQTNEFTHSDKFLEIVGQPKGLKLQIQDLRKFVFPDDLIIREEAFKKAFETSVLHYTGRHIWEDKSIHFVEVKGKVFYDANKQPHNIIGTFRDITEEKKQQQILEENDEKLNLMIEASELGTWELDLQTHEVAYSKKYLEVFGYKDITKLNHSDLLKHLHPDDLGIRTVAFREAMQTGKLQYEARLIWNDKSIHWINGSGKVFYDNQQQPIKMMGTIRDITEEKKQQQELEESEEKFRLLADSMPQHIWTSDPQGNLNYYNKSVLDYSGLTLEKIYEGGWLQIVHPDDRKSNIREWKNAITTGKDFLFEHRFRRYDGEYRWQLSRAIPQRDANGNIQMWVGTSTDIQEQKVFTNKLEKQVGERTDELNQKNIELEKMNKELQSFAYISSHDLQEPLRKIQIFATRILQKEQQNLSDEGKDYFNRMRDAAMRMQTLINDLLAYSRTNITDRKYENTDLQKIIDEVKADLKEELEQKNATIETIDICDIHIIAFQFRQLLQNLISNSLKFSIPDKNPHIIIKCKVAKGEEFGVDKLQANTTYCHIMVSDNGIGFEPEYNEKIFEIFQRLHGRSEYIGTGIGLAIVKKIIENHDGVITARGEKDNGATFDIYIPAEKKD